MKKYLVLENYIKRIEHLIWDWTYDPAKLQAAEEAKFASAGLDYARGLAKVERLLRELGTPLGSDEDSMGSIHWVLFGCLGEGTPGRIKRILEIGTFEGETTRLLSRLFPSSEVVTVELPEDDPIYRNSYLRDQPSELRAFKAKQAANLASRSIRIEQTNSFFLPSRVKGSFDLIWVDGGHLFPEVAWDICNAYNLCAPGGVLMVDDVITHPSGFRDAYVSPDSHRVLEYLAARSHDELFYFLKRNAVKWSAVPRRRKFVALLKKSGG